MIRDDHPTIARPITELSSPDVYCLPKNQVAHGAPCTAKFVPTDLVLEQPVPHISKVIPVTGRIEISLHSTGLSPSSQISFGDTVATTTWLGETATDNNIIPSSSSATSSPRTTRPMLAPLRTQQPPLSTPGHIPSSSSSTRMTGYFADQHVVWSSGEQLSSSVQQSSSSSSSGLLDSTTTNPNSNAFTSSLPSASSSLQQQHQQQQQQQQGDPPLVVLSNVPLHGFSPSSMHGVDASVARFEGSLSPFDPSPPIPLNVGASTSQSQHLSQPRSSQSRSQAAAASSSSTRAKHKGGGRGHRMSGQGKPAVSVSVKNTAGSGSGHHHHGGGSSGGGGGGRSVQPKSSRKQFSACGGCQLRQLSISY
jgi:hypothetical protein